MEIDQKLQEIMKQTGYLTVGGQGNKEENKRILMDLDVVLKSHDCPYIVQCFGTFITNTDVFIAMELMGTCAEKLKKRIQGPIPERILGKMTVAVRQEEPPRLPPAMGFSADFQAFVRDCLTKDHRKRPKYNKLLEHTFIKRYETLEVDVASWFKDVMARTESPRTSGVLGHHLPFFNFICNFMNVKLL
ncbi:PREDICTED: dual specificity mitogen-activated protein kinase kinase 7 [Tinamus guttatus]|uniref:dual specificity mitogen-activated protein kinase kinase 7 n=1 Tax=Tinamus guttatus TaxID=94827 RepID=UPI00052EA3A3|nr:PREDICTED: dual specificity mitogen-activated protein kinase kinase 7 [Tinamus guttatus]